MAQDRHGRNFRLLVGMILLAIAYSGMLAYRHTLTGTYKLDGIIGVLLGLYISSHPAANMVDMLFFGRLYPSSSRGSVVLWWALNILVLLLGWLVIVIGTTRFTVA
jgi:hypothetical protein